VSQVGQVLRIPADVGELAAVRKFVRDAGLSAGLRRPQIDDVVQAVDESVTNIIVHGYRGADGFIEVEVLKVNGTLVVRLRDQARPFDPTTLPDPDTSLPLDKRPYHGMGVFLTRELSDDVLYREMDDGNELTIVKRFETRSGGATC
jgi:anti-sigma regulatory factor (Ser/Thr protein kinase)